MTGQTVLLRFPSRTSLNTFQNLFRPQYLFQLLQHFPIIVVGCGLTLQNGKGQLPVLFFLQQRGVTFYDQGQLRRFQTVLRFQFLAELFIIIHRRI